MHAIRLGLALALAALIPRGAAAGPAAANGPVVCAGPAQIGASPLRRLTRFEYESTIADLLGDVTEVGRHFPEEGGSGFDNNADVAVATRIHAQKYMSAAEEIAARATADVPRLLGCDPARDEGPCVRRWLERFGKRAWRRPLAPAEVASLLSYFRSARAQHDVPMAVRLVLQSILQSPSFLYRIEVGRPVPGRPGVLKLSDWEVASRLSYFLWGSMPDPALFRAAERGQLRTPAQVAAQARRLLDDPRARVTVRRFHDQWLGTTLLERLEKEKQRGWRRRATTALMRKQLDRFVDHVIWEADGRLETLLTTPVTFLNGPLAEVLRVPGVAGDEMVRVETGGDNRAGILTTAAFLAAQARTDDTSPIKRGMFVREHLLCQIPPPPPPDMMMNFLPPLSKDVVTMRDRLEEHRSGVACSRCHKLFDPLGFAFERYDTLGAWRDDDKGHPLDTTGVIVESDVNGEFDGVAQMARLLAQSRQVSDCMVRQWFRFAFGRTESGADACTLAALSKQFAATRGRIPDLLVTMTGTDAFLHRAAPSP